MLGISTSKFMRVGRVVLSPKVRRIVLALTATVALTLACVGDGGVKKGI